jgi:hypothetical protein
VTAEKFEQMITKIHFFAISGQHSAEAAQVICHNARKDPEKYGAVAERPKLRQAKIIDRACLQGSLIKYSDAMNMGKKELGSFTSPFHHRVSMRATNALLAADLHALARCQKVPQGRKQKNNGKQAKLFLEPNSFIFNFF